MSKFRLKVSWWSLWINPILPRGGGEGEGGLPLSQGQGYPDLFLLTFARFKKASFEVCFSKNCISKILGVLEHWKIEIFIFSLTNTIFQTHFEFYMFSAFQFFHWNLLPSRLRNLKLFKMASKVTISAKNVKRLSFGLLIAQNLKKWGGP